MPYLLPPSRFTTRVSLVIETQSLFRLTSPFAYRLPHVPAPLVEPLRALGATPTPDGLWDIVVPAFDETAEAAERRVGQTDLASIPPMLWSIIGPYGRHLLAALVHDFLCQRATSFDTRAAADYVFWTACRDDGRIDLDPVTPGSPASPPLPRSPWTRRVMLWAGVSFGRLWEHRKSALVWLALAFAGGAATSVEAIAWWGSSGQADRIPASLWWICALALAVSAVAATAAARTGDSLGGALLSLFCRVASSLAAIGVVLGGLGLLARQSASWPVLDEPWGSLVAWSGPTALVAGSLLLTRRTPTPSDGWLPLIALLTSPVLLPVAVVTVFAQCLLWAPDALAIVGPAWTVPGPVGFGPLRLRRLGGLDLALLHDLTRHGN